MRWKAFQDYSQLDGPTKTLTMSESKFFGKISAYLAENKLRAALEAGEKYMVVEAKGKVVHSKGPGVHFKPKPPDEEAPFEGSDRKLDGIYDEEPLGFENDLVAPNAKMGEEDPLEEIDLGDGSIKRPTYVSAKLSP